MAPIEFVDEPGGSQPPVDDAAAGDRGTPGRRRPMRWAVAGIAVLVLLAWTLVRPHAGPTARQDPPTPAPSEPTSRGPAVVPRQPAPFQNCPRYAMCQVTAVVPAALVDAVRSQFPLGTVRWTATVEGSHSADTEPVLVRRRVDVGTSRWTLEISVAVDRGTAQLASVPWRLSLTAPSYAHLSTEAAGFTVDLVWLGPAGALPPVERLHRLAADPALVLPG
jgi:hypothetical protein